MGGLAAAQARSEPLIAGPLQSYLGSQAFGHFVTELMADAGVPGVSVAAVDKGRILGGWGFGLADLAARRPMTADTVINIASVTKTMTCVAVLQLLEQGRLQLDDDVNRFLPFSVRNPGFPDTPITLRQLLVHTGTIDDGPSYGDSYACGDPTVGMESWLHAYLVPGGRLFAVTNFHAWAPGAKATYSNIGYAILGLVVERISGLPFTRYCEERIFAPLRMTRSSFYLREASREHQARPYDSVPASDAGGVVLRDPHWDLPPSGTAKVQVPHCLYGNPTIADGMARSTANDLARFLAMIIRQGKLEGARLLDPRSVALMLSPQYVGDGVPKTEAQGLAWVRYSGAIWGKYGGDPGVSTLVKFRPADGRGVVVLTNSSEGERVTNAIVRKVLEFPGGGGSSP